MKKHPWLTTVAVCAALLGVLFLISPFIGFVGEICSKNEYTGDKECASYHLAQYAILWVAQILDAHNGFVTALASVAVAWFTATLYWASVEQGRLTQQSIDLARQEFASTHRPWIKIGTRITTDLKFQSGTTASLGFGFCLENIGTVPAFVAHPYVRFENPGPDGNVMRKKILKEYHAATAYYGISTQTIFPGESNKRLGTTFEAGEIPLEPDAGGAFIFPSLFIFL